MPSPPNLLPPPSKKERALQTGIACPPRIRGASTRPQDRMHLVSPTRSTPIPTDSFSSRPFLYPLALAEGDSYPYLVPRKRYPTPVVRFSTWRPPLHTRHSRSYPKYPCPLLRRSPAGVTCPIPALTRPAATRGPGSPRRQSNRNSFKGVHRPSAFLYGVSPAAVAQSDRGPAGEIYYCLYLLVNSSLGCASAVTGTTPSGSSVILS